MDANIVMVNFELVKVYTTLESPLLLSCHCVPKCTTVSISFNYSLELGILSYDTVLFSSGQYDTGAGFLRVFTFLR
jgi:hypothetical protein